VGGLFALEDAVDVLGRAPVLVDHFRPIGNQAAVHCHVAERVDGGQPVLGGQRDDQLAMNCLRRAPCHDQAPIGLRANVVTARSIWPPSRTSTGLSSTPNGGATAWIAANWPMPAVAAGSRRTTARVTPGATCLSSSSHFPLTLYSYSI